MSSLLTEEQKEAIEKKRLRALEIRREKEKERRAAAAEASVAEPNASSPSKRLKTNNAEPDVILEEFEIDAPPTVTKTDAMKVYCLPEGTIAVLSYEEKENPRNKGWAPMKMYPRSEVRRRARERHGGLEGLIQERKRREMKQFRKDMQNVGGVFKSER